MRYEDVPFQGTPRKTLLDDMRVTQAPYYDYPIMRNPFQDYRPVSLLPVKQSLEWWRRYSRQSSYTYGYMMFLRRQFFKALEMQDVNEIHEHMRASLNNNRATRINMLMREEQQPVSRDEFRDE